MHGDLGWRSQLVMETRFGYLVFSVASGSRTVFLCSMTSLISLSAGLGKVLAFV